MKQGKGKKFLALLLSGMMAVTALPMSAMAAGYDPAGGEDYVKVDLKVGKMAQIPEIQAVYSDEEGEDMLVRTGEMIDFDPAVYAKYADNVFKPGTTDETGWSSSQRQNVYENVSGPSAAANLAANIAAANDVFVPEGGTGLEIEAAPGETVYLAIKMDGSNLTNNKHLKGGTVICRYDTGLEIPNSASSLYVNNIMSGKIRLTSAAAKGNASYATAYNNIDSTKMSFSTGTVTNAGTSEVVSVGDKIFTYQITTTSNSSGFAIPNDSEWDVVVPVKVAAGTAAGEYKVQYEYKQMNSTNSAFQAVAGTNGSLTDSPLTAYGNAAGATDRVVYNNVTIKVTGPTISIPDNSAIDKADDQTIAVTLENDTFTAAATTPSNWTITQNNAGTPPTVKSVSVEGLVATLTLNASGASDDDTYKITAGAAALTGGTALTTSTSFSINRTLDGTVTISGTEKFGETLTAALNGSTASSGIHYQWKRGDATTGTNIGADQATYELVAADIGKTITCVVTADGFVGNRFKTSGTIGKAVQTIVGGTIASATYGDNITDKIATAVTGEQGALSFSNPSAGGVLVVDDKKVYVAKSGSSATIDVKAAATTTYEESNTVQVTLTTANKKDVTLSKTTDNAASGTAYDLAGITLTDAVTTPAAIAQAGTITWTKGTETALTAVLNGSKVTPTLANDNTPGSLVMNAAVTDDYYNLTGTPTLTLTVNATAATTLSLDTDSATAGFTLDKTRIEEKTAETVTVTAPAGYKLKGITAGANISEINVDADGSKGTFKYTAPEGDATATITLTFVQIVDLAISGSAKDYDGTTDVKAGQITADNGRTVSYDSAVYDSEAVGNTHTITITNLTVTNPEDGKEYTFNGGDGTNLVLTNQTINKVDATALTADAGSIAAKDATLATVKAAIRNADILVNGITKSQGKLTAAIATDAQLETAIQSIPGVYTAAVPADKPADVNVEASAADATLTATQKITGDVVLENAPAGTIAAKGGTALPTGITLNGTKLEIGATTTVGENIVELTVTPSDGTTPAYDLKITLTVEAAPEGTPESYNFTALKGEQKFNTAYTFGAPLDTNVNQNGVTTIEIKLNFTQPTPPPSTSGSTVSYDAGKHGTIVEGSASEDVEDGGKPANLPMVEADRPYTFVGWMLDGKLVDPTTVEINEDTVFEASYVKGFISGYEDGTVKTEKNITRAEFATMLVKMTGLYNGGKTYTHSFTDVVKDSWYENFVACAAENKIVNGMTATTFAPNQTITREQAAVMVANAMIASGEFTEDELVETTDKITDLDTAHDYAKKAIATLVEKQVINGYDDKTFRPLKLITRAEASAMLAEADNFEPTEEDIETIKGLESPFEDLDNKHWSYVYMMYASGQLDDSYYA